jgi:ATP-dependent DNA ligase
MNTIHSTPVLENKTSKGLAKFWQGHVVQDGGKFFTQTTFWQSTKDGGETVKQTSAPYEVVGKNIGKANETTPKDQAMSEMASTEKKQRDKGYHESGGTADILLLPMLAHKYAERKHTLSFPASVQPKLDGCRCLSLNGKKWSRGGKEFITEVIRHLQFNTDGHTIDGELLLPADEGGFQDSVKAIKKFREELSPKLEYHVYDMVDTNAPFPHRYETLQRLIEKAPPGVKLVPTHAITKEDEIFAHHSQFVLDGFEGTMVRSHTGAYVIGQRNVQLLKYKDFLDDEFIVTDVLEGGGKEKGCAIFVCETKDKQQFNVRPRGTAEARKKMFADRKTFIGQPLIVQYQNLSDEGIPRFPTGIAIRDKDIQG